jgi:hypothetical protein
LQRDGRYAAAETGSRGVRVTGPDREQLNIGRLQRSRDGCGITGLDFLVGAVLDVIQGLLTAAEGRWPQINLSEKQHLLLAPNQSSTARGRPGPECP